MILLFKDQKAACYSKKVIKIISPNPQYTLNNVYCDTVYHNIDITSPSPNANPFPLWPLHVNRLHKANHTLRFDSYGAAGV